jgi:signal recognition particle GTPase
VQHACCAILHRGKPDPAREALTLNRRLRVAEGTGRKAQRARKILRDLGVRP